MFRVCNQRKIFNLELRLNAFSDEQWWGKLACRVARGGLRPQLGPGVVTQRGPKSFGAFLRSQTAPIVNGPPGICHVQQMASPPLG